MIFRLPSHWFSIFLLIDRNLSFPYSLHHLFYFANSIFMGSYLVLGWLSNLIFNVLWCSSIMGWFWVLCFLFCSSSSISCSIFPYFCSAAMWFRAISPSLTEMRGWIELNGQRHLGFLFSSSLTSIHLLFNAYILLFLFLGIRTWCQSSAWWCTDGWQS